MNKSKFYRFFTASIMTLVFIAAPSLMAQDESSDVEEITVTGSRIQDVNVTSSSHISVVDIEAIDNRGLTRVEDYLNDLPQISPSQSITNSNGASGTASVNLRNLGCGRTLVLMNGRRLAPGTTGGGNCADLNSIPLLLLDKVEVLTGGATSVYGSDAVAGVVNFILDEDFEGFKASATHSFYQHKNDNSELRDLVASYDYALADKDITVGDTTKVAFAFGGDINDGRGHMTAYVEKTDTDPILQGDFDISACALRSGYSGCGGSSTIPPGRFADFGMYGANGFTLADGTSPRLDHKIVGDTLMPREGQAYNYNPTNYFQRPDTRYNAGLFGHYEINDKVTAYVESRYMKSESVAQIAYSGTFGNITRFPCYNPLMSAQQYEVLCGQWVGMGGDHAPDFASGAAALAYVSSLDIAVGNGDIIDYGAPTYHLKRNVEGNPRQGAFFYKNFVNVAGIRGDINDNWSYDVNVQATRVDYQNEYRNDLSVTAINRAVDVVSINGVPTCVSALNGTDSSCMPYPLFNGGLPGDGGLQGVWDGGQELQNYIANATYINGNLKQTIISGYITGELGFSIAGGSNAQLVLGFENKEMSSDYRPDLPSRTGDRSGSGGATLPLAGEYDVDELFFELALPIGDSVSLDLGARFADYSTGADTEAFKVGAFWNVNDSVALRASFQTAQRHATIGEMFSAVSDGLVDLDYDPCGLDPDTGAAPIASAAACAKTGLASNLYGTDLKSPADQYNIRGGGNPDVAPEESESMTVGLVITPDRVPGLTLTVDVFDITVEDGIGSVSAKTALDKCIETGAAGFCNLINRHPTNGTLWLTGGYISTQLTNISEESTRGMDIIFDYAWDTRFGPLSLQGVTTYLDTYKIIELPGSTPISCAGDWGGSCGKNPMPELMGNYSATLSTKFDTDVVLGLRYLGSTDDLNANAIDFSSYTYFDLTANYYGLDNTKITLGVSNLLDKEPGYTSDAGTAPGNGNTFPAYFDAFGRYIFLNLTYGVN